MFQLVNLLQLPEYLTKYEKALEPKYTVVKAFLPCLCSQVDMLRTFPTRGGRWVTTELCMG